jgi:hypothetical protein
MKGRRKKKKKRGSELRSEENEMKTSVSFEKEGWDGIG